MTFIKDIKFELEIAGSKEYSKLAISVLLYDESHSLFDFKRHLHFNELLILDNIKLTKPKTIFAMGRYCAKRAIAQYIPEISFSKINISRGITGYPVVRSDGTNNLAVSIAHTERSAAAVCYDEKFQIGIDIELPNVNYVNVIRTQLSNRELDILPALDMRDNEFCHILWTAKEALGKALKTGFTIPMELFEISSIQSEGERYHVEFLHFPKFKAYSFYVEEYVVTVAYPSECRLIADF